jgi:hypothetical protein
MFDRAKMIGSAMKQRKQELPLDTTQYTLAACAELFFYLEISSALFFNNAIVNSLLFYS